MIHSFLPVKKILFPFKFLDLFDEQESAATFYSAMLLSFHFSLSIQKKRGGKGKDSVKGGRLGFIYYLFL